MNSVSSAPNSPTRVVNTIPEPKDTEVPVKDTEVETVVSDAEKPSGPPIWLLTAGPIFVFTIGNFGSGLNL